MLKIYRGTLRSAFCTYDAECEEWSTVNSADECKTLIFCNEGLRDWNVDKHHDKVRLACSLVDDGDGIAKVASLAQFLRHPYWSHWAAEELIRRSVKDDDVGSNHVRQVHFEMEPCSHCGTGYNGVQESTSVLMRSCDPHLISWLVPVYWWPEIK